MVKIPLLAIAGVPYQMVGDRLIAVASLYKSADPIKRVMRWYKLDIGISHDPGDKRHGRSMRAGYGHIRGSYGDAEDGMSIDVYVGPDLGSREVFRIKQIFPPESGDKAGELDEYKFIIGTWTEAEAKKLYLRHMPKRFFGGVERVSLKSLEKYQR